jgi:hypothetical protein
MEVLWGVWKDDTQITADRRNAWISFSQTFSSRDRFGNSIRLSPWHWFLRFGVFRARASMSPHLFPPLEASCNYFPQFTFSFSDDGIELIIDPLPVGDELVYFSKIPPQQTTRNFCPNLSEYCYMVTESDTNPILLIAKSSMPIGTFRYFFKYRSIDGSGRPSSTLYSFIDCTRVTEEYTCECTGDNWIESWNPNTNLGTNSYLQAFHDAVDTSSSILIFDLSTLPEDFFATEALLYIRTREVGTPNSISVYGIKVSWTELGSTWNSRNGADNWTTPGLGSGTDRDASPHDTASVSSANTWYSLDITDLLNEWVAGSRSNFGVLIQGLNVTTSINFSSREHNPPTYSPYLKVTG